MKLIHIARIFLEKRGYVHLYLRQIEPNIYRWYEHQSDNSEIDTGIWGANVEESILFARKAWKTQEFSPLNCGFRYTLPERDEHGMNALFYQMAASYASMNGVYFDDELGSNCIVQNTSLEARQLWKQLILSS